MLDSYKNLIVWQKAVDLVCEIYSLTKKFPREEIYGLSAQMRRAAISIPSNIAEGSRRKDLPEYLQFLRTSDASSAELETQIIISKKLYSNLDYSEVVSLLEEVQKMMSVLLRKLEEKRNPLKPKTQNLKPNQSGVAVILAVLLMGVFLSITLTLSAIFIPKIRTASDIKRSVGAIYAAESGIEWCLYVSRIGLAATPVMDNGATVINGNTNAPFVSADCSVFPIKSVGTYQGITRTFEVSF